MKNKVYVTEEESIQFESIFSQYGIGFYKDNNGKYFISGTLICNKD